MSDPGKWVYESAPPRSGSFGGLSTGPTYRSVFSKNGFPTLEGVQSLYDVFQSSVRQFSAKQCLGVRPAGSKSYVWETYQEVALKVEKLASGLQAVGVPAHGRAGIYSTNCPEWMQTMQACNRMSVYTIPLYDTLGEEAVEYCVNHSEASIIFVSNANWSKLSNTLPKLQAVHTVVFFGAEVDRSVAAGKKVYSFSEFIALGEATPAAPRPPQGSDLCTIMYTSGTSGVPKGVLLTHSMLLHSIRGMAATTEQLDIDTINSSDVFLSFLPLAHVLDRIFEEMLISVGGKIGYYSGDVKFLADDLMALRPTIFVGVPRVYDRIYQGVMKQVKASGGLKKWLFDTGYNRKLRALKSGKPYHSAAPLFDKIVFSKIKARLGGNVRIALSGAAPLAPHVEDFLRVTLCCYFGCGYGLTESCAASFLAMQYDQEYTIGIPCPSIEYRLESIPELKYDAQAQPPRGEICLKGPTMCQGYYKEEEKTAEAMDKDGYFHTGDVGEVLPNGALKIIDRKKQIFKLSQGEYVAVEKVEAAYQKVDVVAQVWIYGNSMESNLVAVVVPEEDQLAALAQKKGITGSFKDLVSQEAINSAVLEEMNRVAKQEKLRGFEMVRAVILDSVPFSVDNDLMTPTFKFKRPQLQRHYQSAIDEAYKKINSR